MNFEVGKYYVRRNGTKVYCVFTTDPFANSDGQPDPFQIGMLSGGGTDVTYVTTDGQFCPDYECELDIVGEWKECTPA